jgi:hypothetical protein
MTSASSPWKQRRRWSNEIDQFVDCPSHFY